MKAEARSEGKAGWWPARACWLPGGWAQRKLKPQTKAHALLFRQTLFFLSLSPERSLPQVLLKRAPRRSSEQYTQGQPLLSAVRFSLMPFVMLWIAGGGSQTKIQSRKSLPSRVCLCGPCERPSESCPGQGCWKASGYHSTVLCDFG